MVLETKIKFILEKNEKTLKWLAQEIEMSEQNLYKIFKRNSIETKHLEKIAEVFGIQIGYFFDESTDIKAASVKTYGECPSCEKLKDEIVNLKKIIELQDKLLKK